MASQVRSRHSFSQYPRLLQKLQDRQFFDTLNQTLGLATEIWIIPSTKRRSLELQIHMASPNSSCICLRVPSLCTQSEVLHFLLQKQDWLYRQAEKIRRFAQHSPENIQVLQQKRLAFGEEIVLLGRSYSLQKHCRSDHKHLRLNSQTLSFPCPQGSGFKEGSPNGFTGSSSGSSTTGQLLGESETKQLEKALRHAALRFLRGRCLQYSKNFQAHPKTVKIRKYKARWGSCSSNGEITFNWQIIFAPVEIIDYVIVHELAHLIEFNHSADFWNLVSEILPHYHRQREWLHYCGHYLLRF